MPRRRPTLLRLPFGRAALAGLGVVVAIVVLVPVPAGAGESEDDAVAELIERYVPFVAIRAQEAECDRDGEGCAPTAVEIVLDNPEVVLRDGSGSVVTAAPSAAGLFDAGADHHLVSSVVYVLTVPVAALALDHWWRSAPTARSGQPVEAVSA